MESKENNARQFFKKFGGLIFVLLFVAALFVYNAGILWHSYDVPANRSRYPVVYTKDNTLNVMLENGKKPNAVSDYLVSDENTTNVRAVMSDSGESLYFHESFNEATNTGSLFASFDGKTKLPVSSNAYSGICLTEDGTYALFLEAAENNGGNLYLYKKKGEKRKIADGVKDYAFSEDAKYVGYVEINGDFYIASFSGDREKIDSGVSKIEAIKSGGSAVYTKQKESGEHSLYCWTKADGALNLAERVTYHVNMNKNSDKLYYVDDADGTLYEKNGNKKPKKIDTGVAFIMEAYGKTNGITPDMKYGNFLYGKNHSAQDFTYDIYLKRGGKQTEKFASSGDVEEIAASQDFSIIAYISEAASGTRSGKLYMRQYGAFKNSEPVQIGENISSFKMIANGRKIAYISDGNLYMYDTKSKRYQMIAENVKDNHYRFTVNGSGLYYISGYTEEKGTGNLYAVKTMQRNPKSVKVDSDVYYAFKPRTEKQVIYMKDYDINTGKGTLVQWKNKKSRELDSGAISVLFED
jgi:hypothetical protein